MLKLEAGKRYVRRDGKLSHPLEEGISEPFPFWDAHRCCSYQPNGSFTVDGEPAPADLIREYVEPVVEPASGGSALQIQIGGDHYRTMAIQPVEYIMKNGIPFAEGCVIKYVSRWRTKGGVADLKKARHFLDILIENEGQDK